MMKQTLSLCLSLAFFASSCAPVVQDRVFAPPQRNFTSKAEDVRLNLRLREFGEEPPALSWAGTVPTSTYFEQADNLFWLGEKNARPDLRKKALQWIRRFYETPGTAPMMDLASAPYLNLAAAQTEEQVQPKLDEVLGQMDEALPVILEHVRRIGISQPPTSKEGLDAILAQAEDFNQRLVASIPKMNLPPVIADGFKTELQKVTEPLFAELRSMLVDFKTVKSLTQALALIDSAMQIFEVELPTQLARSMKQGRGLARGLDTMRDEQDALTVIVDVWRMLTPAERVKNIKAANEELYNFLARQSEKELNCLRTRGCLGGPVDGVVKKVFVLPKIRKYGVANIRRELNSKTLAYVKETIADFAEGFVKTMPQTFAENITKAWKEKQARVTDVRNDLQSYVNRVGKVWANKILPQSQGQIPGFEVGSVTVQADRRSALGLKAVKGSLSAQGEAVGSSLAVNSYLIQSAAPGDEMALRASLAQINKLVALSGYRDVHENLIPGLLAPVRHSGKYLDILDFEDAKNVDFSFRVPDVIPLKDAFHADPKMVYERDFSVAGLASQIKGLSQLLYFTADWKESNFDHFLTPIQAQDLTEDAKDPALQQSLFPKDMLFALNVGTVSVLLQDILKKATPVFLLTLENKTMWANQYTSTSKETAVMAGAVDIKNGQRSSLVRSRDVAKLILGLSEFIVAVEGVENTRSPLLLKPNIKGHPPLDAVISGRKEVRTLLVALSNFLSNKMKLENSLIATTWTVDSGEPSAEVDIVDTQSLAIRALVRAHEATGIDAYRWSAEEIYYAMNRQLFNPQKEFYLNSDGTALSFQEKVCTLRALSELKPYLPEASQQQLQKVMNPWLDALGLIL